ncbi:hypothetical protein HDU98_012225 [Podochytrium sp. JEL0797]|nr:hypothetical protein HDU98_012225 [Podochytrium sp. JEL0797]
MPDIAATTPDESTSPAKFNQDNDAPPSPDAIIANDPTSFLNVREGADDGDYGFADTPADDDGDQDGHGESRIRYDHAVFGGEEDPIIPFSGDDEPVAVSQVLNSTTAAATAVVEPTAVPHEETVQQLWKEQQEAKKEEEALEQVTKLAENATAAAAQVVAPVVATIDASQQIPISTAVVKEPPALATGESNTLVSETPVAAVVNASVNDASIEKSSVAVAETTRTAEASAEASESVAKPVTQEVEPAIVEKPATKSKKRKAAAAVVETPTRELRKRGKRVRYGGME